MGSSWGPPGPTGPTWAPCWPHETCYLGCSPCLGTSRDNVVNASSQWETTLQCNVSHWLGAYIKWSLNTQLWFLCEILTIDFILSMVEGCALRMLRAGYIICCTSLQCCKQNRVISGGSMTELHYRGGWGGVGYRVGNRNSGLGRRQRILKSPEHQQAWYWLCRDRQHVDGLVQERRNSIAKAMELRLSCTNPSMCYCSFIWIYLDENQL